MRFRSLHVTCNNPTEEFLRHVVRLCRKKWKMQTDRLLEDLIIVEEKVNKIY